MNTVWRQFFSSADEAIVGGAVAVALNCLLSKDSTVVGTGSVAVL